MDDIFQFVFIMDLLIKSMIVYSLKGVLKFLFFHHLNNMIILSILFIILLINLSNTHLMEFVKIKFIFIKNIINNYYILNHL